ncbi:MAG: DUF4179 domain-containing protein [Clostridiales bacterium]|nr:DUF4179 domain-containing protein [Clostridiales bacterium]
MMNDREIQKKVQSAINDCTRGIDEAPSLRSRLLMQAKGEAPVKKRFTAAMALAMTMILLVTGAVAATLLHTDVLSWLFRSDQNDLPNEVLQLVTEPGLTHSTEQLKVTLAETLFDGNNLSVGLTLENPTDELLIYTVDHATLNGVPLVYESAMFPYNGIGQAMGGELEGKALSKQTRVFATYTGTLAADPANEAEPLGDLARKQPLQAAEEATFSICVEVFRPRTTPVYLAPDEHLNGSLLAPNTLAVERETDLVQLGEVVSDRSLLEKVASVEAVFPIQMQAPAITEVTAQPGVYENALFALEVEHFSLKPTSGRMDAAITIHEPEATNKKLPKDLTFFEVFPENVFEQAKATGDPAQALRLRTVSGGSRYVQGSDTLSGCRIEASFGATSGLLPGGVYLVWYTDNNGALDWDTAIHVPLK